MSTLLTPIVTQLELDRDRFKTLVNGLETDTVSLEGRTEKSISGQVKDRINEVAADFTTARNEAVQAATDAQTALTNAQSVESTVSGYESTVFSYVSAAEGARDQTIALKQDVDQIYTDTSVLKSDTQLLKDTASTLRDDALTFKNESQAARDAAQLAESNASASESNVNTAEISVLDAKSTVSADKSIVLTAKNDALSAADRAETAVSDFTDTVTTRLAKPPIPLFPQATDSVEPGVIPFIVSYPIYYGNSVKWSERNIEVEEFDGANWVVFKSYTTASLNFRTPENTSFVTTNEYPESGTYRYRVQDVFTPVEGESTTYSSEWTNYIEFTTSVAGSGVAPLPSPTVTSSNSEGGVVLDATAFTDPLVEAYWVIYESSTGKLEFISRVTSASSLKLHISNESLIEGANYNASCRIVADDGDNTLTEWSPPVSFSRSGLEYTKDFSSQKSEFSYGQVDARTATEFVFDNTLTDDDVTITFTNLDYRPKWVTVIGGAGAVSFDSSYTTYGTLTIGANITRIRVNNTPNGVYLTEEISA